LRALARSLRTGKKDNVELHMPIINQNRPFGAVLAGIRGSILRWVVTRKNATILCIKKLLNDL